ncbi:oocyte zinc finger protein XlCOF29-like [Colias croceus]|uniref:oocyte zinc finger protein XlCOF29-like n=1 Tax=Colias crocea TaxID=72248 RepID=UPI001E27D03D|nr:oocyte zinc finger protein XlCOF29-like [Colias croceus]
MFVSHDKSVTKKKIQKPNILRRKPKAIVLKSTADTEFLDSLNDKDSETTTYFVESDTNIDNESTTKKLVKGNNTSKKVYQIINDDSILRDYQIIENEVNTRPNNLLPAEISIENSICNDEDLVQSSLNIDSFLIDNTTKQNITLSANVTPLKNQVVKASDKLCFGFIDDSNRLVIEPCDVTQEGFCLEPKSDVVSTMVPLSAVSTIQGTIDNYAQMPTIIKTHKFSIEDLTQKSVRYKCDEPNCSKEFLSEQKLVKHKNSHNKECRVPRQTTLECPVKKLDGSGIEEPCGRTFQVRGDLIKHLNEEHAPEDAGYKCEECGRSFFWASGLRAHSRSHAAGARAALACPWPGCGRVFRQPCRLREHSRAHTGDKPYHCSYPNCGWSFRTASKLLRHSRGHRGDRRHPCAACGRAFLRREHLREHSARHHAARNQPHACPRPDCKQTFTNMSSLYTHMKKVHPKEDTNEIEDPVPADNEQILKKPTNMFMVNLWDGSAVELVEEGKDESQDVLLQSNTSNVGIELEIENAVNVDMEGVRDELEEEIMEVEGEVREMMDMEGEGQSARTHCTWPLTKSYKSPNDGYVLEDDVQVGQSEGSESNIYTVRSDLFLHGSVFHSEDSEQMCSTVRVCERGLAALDADLLLGAPSLDISQEELYTDAVDESSFRVFLLSGEELS